MHLLPGQIIEAANRQLSDPEAVAHLSLCQHCKGKIEDYRSTRMAVVPASATQNSAPSDDCPPMERLARYSAGHRDPELAGHIAKCDRCAWIVNDAMEAGTEAAPVRKKKRNIPVLPLVGSLVVILLAAVAFFILRPKPSTTPKGVESNEDITEMLARAYSEVRPFEFRLTGAAYVPIRPPANIDRNGFIVEAQSTISRRLTTDPGDLQALAFRGRALLLLGKYQEAIPLLTRSQDAFPGDPTPRRDLGCAYLLRGIKESRPDDFETAITFLKKVVQEKPDDLIAIFDLALAYERGFHATEALDQWRSFTAENKDSLWQDEANKHLSALEKMSK